MARPSLATVVALLLLAMLAFTAFAATQRARSQTQAPERTRPEPAPAAVEPRPSLQPIEEVAPQRPAPKPVRYRVLQVREGRTVALRSKPRGEVLASVDSTTEFGSPTTLAVARRSGEWLGVTSTALPNNEIGWLKARDADVAESRTRLSIHADLSERRVRLMNGRRVVHEATVAIGRSGSTTPTGRFAITDKIAGSQYGPYYGCCILALSGKQPNLPPGWNGGNRLAIHGTDDLGSIGRPSSAGCLRARDEDLRPLMRRVPLGTPVFIRP
jgi:lipoprotein-anchoring transpeptidase ErfK/SrfK